MNLEHLESLQTAEGQAALDRAMELAPDESTFLSCFNRLSKHYPADLTRSALQTALLRRRAREKFTLADRMYFTREALEQSTAEPVARHRAVRFEEFGLVGDFCCGVGGDAIALALHRVLRGAENRAGGPIIAVDRDAVRLRMAQLNLDVYGLADRATLLQSDVLLDPLPDVEALFVDPDRRVGCRRQLSISACQPSLDELLKRLPRDLPVAVKLAPGVSWSELERFAGESEFVSLAGELKECVLWLGPTRRVARRATLLPSSDSLAAEAPAPAQPARLPGEFLYDPDPAVLRAGLVSDLALLLDARPIDPSIAYLTSDRLVSTPFARCWAIEAALPFHLKRLREYLRERRVGRITVSRRGSPIEPDELIRKLKLTGDEARRVILTRVQGRPYALVAVP